MFIILHSGNSNSGMENLLINHTRVSHRNHHLHHCLLRHYREKTFFWWMTIWVHLQLLVLANEMHDSVCDWYRPWRRISGPFLCSAAMRLWHHVEHWKWNEKPSCSGRRDQYSWLTEEKRSGEGRRMGGWKCWAAGEHLLPAGSQLPPVTLFQFHRINGWWIGNCNTRTRMEASIIPHIIIW